MNEVRDLAIALDFDGVLAVQIWPEPGIGPAIRKNLIKARALVAKGEKIVIHTARPWSDQNQLEKWCMAHGLKVDGVVCGKYLGKMYIDDKSVHSDKPEWTLDS